MQYLRGHLVAGLCSRALSALLLSFSPYLLAQSTIGTGSIVGTITDPSGAIIVSAQVLITNSATGQQVRAITNSAGAFNSGALAPGEYTLQVTASDFTTVRMPIAVQVGNTASGSVKLPLGPGKEVLTVTSSAIQVNVQQAIVQGVVNSEQIDNLPINGRNFLDLAQLVSVSATV